MAYVTMQGLQFGIGVPQEGPMPINFWAPFNIPLTYNPADGYLEGHTPRAWEQWFQVLDNGLYTVNFWVKSSDDQVATAQANFSIYGQWVSGNDPTSFFHEQQTW